jgi:pilus assembly protein Flp/PilA
MLYGPSEEGQGLAEYALILVLIALVVFLLVVLLGTQVSTMWSRIVSEYPKTT